MPKRKKSKSTAIASKRALSETDTKRVSRGEDMYGYGEQKKSLNLSLTPTVIDKLNVAAAKKGMSKSELIERWARKQL